MSRSTRTGALLTALLVTGSLASLAPAQAASAPPNPGNYFVGPPSMSAAKGLPTNYVGDMPDASVYYENGVYYAYTTSSNGSFVPVYTSRDGMKTWQTREAYAPPRPAPNGVNVRPEPIFMDALVGPGKWVAPNPGPDFSVRGAADCRGTFTLGCTHMVSPSVVKVPSGPAAGKYLMAYGAWFKTDSTHIRMAVGTAIATNPAGPFTDYSTSPVVTWNVTEGAIDPHLFVDRGKVYLQWMNQGGTGASEIKSQEIAVAANGVATPVGPRATMLSTAQAQPWEKTSGPGNVVEQPSLVWAEGSYYQFFSSRYWPTAGYRMGYAKCAGPLGPCTRAPQTYNPIMGASQPWNADGPGGGAAFRDASGQLRVIYQAWAYGKPGYNAANNPIEAKTTPDRQRFGHVATLVGDGIGNLVVAQRSRAQAPWGCASSMLFPMGDNWVDMSRCQYPLKPNVFSNTKDTDFWRVGGPNRYATSAMTSRRAGFAPGTAEVLIASGQNFPDALSAGAYSRGASPVLLVPATGTLPAEIRAELARLRPGKVTIVGGPTSVSPAMEGQIRQVAGNITRVAGANRYATAAALSRSQTGSTVYLAYGKAFPDALAGGVGAGKANAPLLLTDLGTLPQATVDALRARAAGPGVTRVVILGGATSISPAVEAQVKGLFPGAVVDRMAGANRYDTAALVSRDTFAGGGKNVVLSAGTNFPDALSAVPLAIRQDSPLLLTKPACQPAETLREVARQSPHLTTGTGLLQSVSDRALLHGGC